MKNIRSFFLPAVAAGVASLLTSGLASADNVFVVNNGNNTVSEISNGVVSTFIASDLNSPTGIAINSQGDFFVANNGDGGYIEEFAPNGSAMGQYSTGENNPRGIAFDGSGNLFVAVQASHSILEIPVGGGAGTTVATGFGAINSVAFDAGTLYATDGGTGTVDTVSGGVPTALINSLSSPNGLAFDSAGNLFIVQHGTSVVSEFTAGGATVTDPFITQTSSQGPKTIAIDSLGNFFVTDNSDNTVTEYNSSGALIDTFASSTFSGPCFVATELSVPEPASYALMLAGLGLLYFMRRKKMVEVTI